MRLCPAGLVVTVVALLALAGCGSYPAQITAPGGADTEIGQIAIRDARFTASPPRAGGQAYSTGQDAPLTLTIVNTGDVTDRLESVTSPIATGARIDGDTQILGGFALASGYDQVQPAQTLTATVRAEITLTGLRGPIRAGLTYPVRFTFARAGSAELQIPVDNPDALPPRAEQTLVYPPPQVGDYPGTPAGPR